MNRHARMRRSPWRPFGSWLLTVLIAAAAMHFLAVWAFPRALMTYFQRSLMATGAVNAPQYAPPTTHLSRQVVMPSPDLLYGICPYDLAGGPLLVTVEPPTEASRPEGYWSTAVYAANSDNIFVQNDQSGVRGFLLYDAAAAPVPGLQIPQLASPSRTGLVLFRALVLEESDLPRADAIRRGFSCRPYEGAK